MPSDHRGSARANSKPAKATAKAKSKDTAKPKSTKASSKLKSPKTAAKATLNGAGAATTPDTPPSDPTGRTVTLQNIRGSQLLLRYLAMEGVTKVFGVPGAAIMQLLEDIRLQGDSFQYVICRQETGAAYMADGYARVSGGLGVVAVTSGPGATNAVTGTMNAHSSGTALLTISGEVSEKFFGKGYLQEGIDADLSIDDVFRAATRYSAVIDNPANFATILEQALRDALSVPRRATHLSIPLDMQQLPAGSIPPIPPPPAPQIPTVTIPTSTTGYRATSRAGDPASVEVALNMLLAAERPLIMVGNGARQALLGSEQSDFQNFVERFSIPVMTTPDGKGIFPETHSMSLRNYGLGHCAWPLMYMNGTFGTKPTFDALMVLGSTLGELATSPATLPAEVYNPELLPDGPFVHVDLDPSVIGRTFPVDLGVVADVGATVHQLFELGQATPVPASAQARSAFIATIKKSDPSPAPPAPTPTGPVHPIALMRALNDAMPSETHVFIDCGNCVGWSLSQLVIAPPTQFHAALSMGPMGFSVGAVVGGKMAAPPNVPCVAITGDGAFLMHGVEVSTASAYGVGAIWVVLDDNNLAMVSQGMNQFFPGLNWSDYYSLGAPDLVGFATALGANAVKVSTTSQLAPALAGAFKGAASNKPQVVVVEVDPTAIPPYYVPSSPPPPSARKAG